ncbi:hypothetical protein [Curtobacterium sp. MMLR14_010]|uniref:hypothetical protein n=1 Tax=Curtobacterium sp. MMLR14_010 TaxID=1898743 RepID=UPI0034A0CAB6
MAYFHDPDVYDLAAGLTQGLPALAALRDEGVVRRSRCGRTLPALPSRCPGRCGTSCAKRGCCRRETASVACRSRR